MSDHFNQHVHQDFETDQRVWQEWRRSDGALVSHAKRWSWWPAVVTVVVALVLAGRLIHV